MIQQKMKESGGKRKDDAVPWLHQYTVQEEKK